MKGFSGNSFRVRSKGGMQKLAEKQNKDILEKETFSFCFGRNEVLQVLCSQLFKFPGLWKIIYLASKGSVCGTSL